MSKKSICRSGFGAVLVLVLLGGCTPDGSPGGLLHYDPDAYAPVTPGDKFDMKLQRAETSPIAGASARVLQPPPGVIYSGAPVGDCVTDAGYCPLAAQTEPGQNCICAASDGMYGGSTGVPPQYNTTTNPDP